MLIGKPGSPTTSISTADASSIEVRGRDLCRELMGEVSFTELFHLLVTGRTPTESQRFFLDLLLVAIAEHGLTPTVQAARMTHATDPDCLQGALAAGILGCGTVVLGTAELCGRLLVEMQERVAAGEEPARVAEETAHAIRVRGDKVPGFGHPLHRPVDPRAARILELADARGAAGPHVALARLLPAAVEKAWGRPLPMNVSMAIAGVLLDLDFPPAMIKAVPLLARTGGLLAHLAEERANPIGFLMASQAEAAISYERGEDEEPA